MSAPLVSLRMEISYAFPTKRSDACRTAMLNLQRNTKKKVMKAYKSTVQTWAGSAGGIPTFDDKSFNTRTIDQMGIDIGLADGGGRPNDIWRFLNGGTSYRWAHLSDDWESKTSPGSIASGAGAGYVEIRGRDMINAGMPAEGGIAARDWSKQITEKFGPRYMAEIAAIYRRFWRMTPESIVIGS